MATPTELNNAIDRFLSSEEKQFNIVQGPIGTNVTTNAGSVPSYLEHQYQLGLLFNQTLAEKEAEWDNSVILSNVVGYRDAAQAAQLGSELARDEAEGFRDEAETAKNDVLASSTVSHVLLTENQFSETEGMGSYPAGVVSLMRVTSASWLSVPGGVGFVITDRRSQLSNIFSASQIMFGENSDYQLERKTFDITGNFSQWYKPLQQNELGTAELSNAQFSGNVDIDGALTTGEQDLNNPESVINNSQVMGLIANPLPSARKTQLITSGIHNSLFTAGNVVSDSWIGDCYVIQEKFCVSYEAGVNTNVALYAGRLRVTPGVGNSQYLTMTSGVYASAFAKASDVSVGVNLASYNGAEGCKFFVGLGQFSNSGTVCEVGWLFVGQSGNNYNVYESYKVKGDNNINGRDITIPHTDVSGVSVLDNVNMNFFGQPTIPIKMYLVGEVLTMEIDGSVLSHSQAMVTNSPLSPIIGVHGLTSSGGLQIQQLTVIDTY